MAEKKNIFKNKKFWSDIAAIVLVLIAIVFSLLFFKQRIETIKEVEVFKNLTQDWQESPKDILGGKVSFKYPQDWKIEHSVGGVGYANETTCYDIFENKEKITEDEKIRLCLSPERSIDIKEAVYAIQISIPLDKKNYLIFSTSTNNENKEIFYNIPTTLQLINN